MMEATKPGSGEFSGSALMNQAFHFRELSWNEETMPQRRNSLSSSVMLSQQESGSQLLQGLFIWLLRSRTWKVRQIEDLKTPLMKIILIFFFWFLTCTGTCREVPLGGLPSLAPSYYHQKAVLLSSAFSLTTPM